MNRTVTLLVALAVLVGGLAPAVAVAQPSQTATDDATIQAQTDENATATDAPGATLAGVIGTQKAEIQGEVEQRAFGHQVAAAATNQSRAQVLAHTQERLQERLDGLQERHQALERARDNGNISDARYRAEVTQVAAKTATVRHMANNTERVAIAMPADTLEANGVNVTAIQVLRTQAQHMSGPEVMAIAHSVAGTDMGEPFGPPASMPGALPDEMPGHQPNNTTMTPGGMNQTGQQTTSGTSVMTNTTATTTTTDRDSGS